MYSCPVIDRHVDIGIGYRWWLDSVSVVLCREENEMQKKKTLVFCGPKRISNNLSLRICHFNRSDRRVASSWASNQKCIRCKSFLIDNKMQGPHTYQQFPFRPFGILYEMMVHRLTLHSWIYQICSVQLLAIKHGWRSIGCAANERTIESFNEKHRLDALNVGCAAAAVELMMVCALCPTRIAFIYESRTNWRRTRPRKSIH